MFLLFLLAVCCTGALSQQYPQGYDVFFYIWSVSLNGRLLNGECCDFTNATVCPASCDVHFVVCVREHNETSDSCNSTTSSHITFFHYAYINTNNLTFLEGDNVFGVGLHNPLEYSYTGNWSKHIQLVLIARDFDLYLTHYAFIHIDYLVINWIISGGSGLHKRSYNGAYNNMVVETGLSVECWYGWYGEYCSDFCLDSDDATGHYECDEDGEKTCLEGWIGVHCLTGVCDPKCPTGASCNMTNRVCECLQGYIEVGEECKCIPSPDCNPIGGFCQQPEECHCHTGYTGTDCYTIDYCLLRSNPCSNGGICVSTDNDTYVCQCVGGYQGTHCEFMACPNTGCSASLPCGENGTCTDTTTGVHCMCDRGYTGRCCDYLVNFCLNNPCAHGTCENKIGDYACNCDTGYTSKDCDIPIDECSLHDPCQNAGTCQDQIAGYKCVCTPSYTGTHCTESCTDPELCQCESDCVYGACDMTDGYTCVCTPGYTGQRCEEDIDDCLGACQNGAVCVDGLSSFHCHCSSGYTGVTCADDVDECSQTDPCLHGSCANTDGSYNCSCEEAYTGTLCDTFQQLDYCAKDNPCQNGGSCYNDAFSSRCECALGYNGTLCEDQTDPCRDIICQNSGTCRGGECVCPVSYTDPVCSQLVDVCEELVLPKDCHGVCVNDVTLPDGYLCECERGYTGQSCHEDIDDCVIGACQHGGSCVDGLDEFFCDCEYGYTGERCEEELDTCETNQCMNGGTCVKDGTGYRCLCEEGEVSPICQEIADCDRRSCNNKGECKGVTQDLKEALCVCDSGYTGQYCNSLIDYCADDPCDNGATCYRGVYSYYCRCESNVTGCVESGQPSAELIPGVHNSVMAATGGAVLGVSGTILCVIILVSVFCGVRHKRKSVQRQGRERATANNTSANNTIYGHDGNTLLEPPSYDTLQLAHYLITPAAYPGLKVEKDECFQNPVCYENKIPL